MTQKRFWIIGIVIISALILLGFSRGGAKYLSSSALQSPVCEEGYYLQNGGCVSDCSVAYVSTSLEGDLNQINTDFDFLFTNKALEQDFQTSANMISFTYSRLTNKISGKFDIGTNTYICKPFQLDSETGSVLSNTICTTEKESILTCDGSNVEYSLDGLCSDDEYTYVLKNCFPELILTGSVSPAGTSIIGQPVTFSANPQGGNGKYTYAWSGTDGISGDTNSTVKTFTTLGKKTATVTVTSGRQSKAITLTVTVIPPPLEIALSVSPASTQRVGRNIIYTAVVSGGKPPYKYTWSGSDNLTGTTSSIIKKYATIGKKVVSVTIESADGGREVKTIDVTMLSQFPPLSVSCNPSRINNTRNVMWRANISGGNGVYRYKWTLYSAGINNQTQVAQTPTTQKYYTTSGIKRAQLVVTSGSESKSIGCSITL